VAERNLVVLDAKHARGDDEASSSDNQTSHLHQHKQQHQQQTGTVERNAISQSPHFNFHSLRLRSVNTNQHPTKGLRGSTVTSATAAQTRAFLKLEG
jgi:hypothetical protein